MKQALVYLNDILAAKLIEDDLGYEFRTIPTIYIGTTPSL